MRDRRKGIVMGQCVFRDNTIISDYGRPYIVSEVNSSHGGNMERARQMIDVSVDAGCDCVKFQSWSADSLYSKTYYDSIPHSRRFVSKFSLKPEQLKELSIYCREKGISFSSTPYCEEEVDFLINECDAPFVKISSMEVNNPYFLEYIGNKRLPVVLSTGMSDSHEIKKAVEVLENAGVTQMVILHCVSIYPVKLSEVNLNNIIGFRDSYPRYPIGFSDHTEGYEAAVAAVALGAALIEKHITLDKSRAGMDNGMAIEPDELRCLADKCRNIYKALGGKDRIVSEEELAQRNNMRRSVVSTRYLSKGTVIQREDLYVKRPGTGISPEKIDDLVGKTVAEDIEEDTVIQPSQIMDYDKD
jgi:N-acetylneuraminate synthase